MTLETKEDIEAVWSRGSYSRQGQHYLGMAARLVGETGVEPDDDVVDIGCGTGNVAISAARREAEVAGVDITPDMLEQARENARIAGVDSVTWYEGDATELPFEEDSFDVTLSALGHMYGDPPDVATRELIRVTRPGGRVGFTAWSPTGLFPAMAGVLVAYLPPEKRPEFSEPPFMWGDPDVVAERLATRVERLESQTDRVAYPAMSPGHFWQELVTHSGLFISFLEKVDDRSALREQMIETIEPYFVDNENVVELEYLLTTATVTTEG